MPHGVGGHLPDILTFEVTAKVGGFSVSPLGRGGCALWVGRMEWITGDLETRRKYVTSWSLSVSASSWGHSKAAPPGLPGR